jgi:peroxiredoxin
MKILFTALVCLLPLLSVAAIPEDPTEVNPVEVGSTVPDIQLTTSSGTQVALRELVAKQPTIIIFYRGGWCPYCNRHLAALGEIEAELLDKGYQIIAISPDRIEKVREVANEADYHYQLYSDSTMEAAIAFGLAFKVDSETYKKLEGYGIDLELASGEDHHLLPVPAVFIVERDGRISFRYFNPDYTERLSTEALLETIN